MDRQLEWIARVGGYDILTLMEKYYKIAPSHMVGHVYEHVIALKLDRLEIGKKNLPVLDYDLFGYTWDTTVLLEYRPEGIPSSPITTEEVEKVIGELECEYRKTIRVKDMLELVNALNILDKLPWVPEDEFKASPKFEPGEDTFGKELIFLPEKEMGERFGVSEVRFSFNEIDDELRPVALYLLYVIVRGADAIIGRDYNYFDDGAEYADLEDKTELTETYFTRTNSISESKLIKEIRNSVEIMTRYGLCEKLCKYLIGRRSNELPFSPDELYRYGGYYVGKRGWERLAKPENVERILKSLSVSVAK